MSNSTHIAQRRFDVAVIGGGVCGLTCAVALQRAGVSVQVFEAAVSIGTTSLAHLIAELIYNLQAVFSEIGAGLGVGSFPDAS